MITVRPAMFNEKTREWKITMTEIEHENVAAQRAMTEAWRGKKD